jgi:hypothetical protein
MGLRGLSITEESTFDFEPPSTWTQWPSARYGQHSPHLQYAKGTKSPRRKHQTTPSKPTRPSKSRKPKATARTKKVVPEPTQGHGPIPPRDLPINLLNLPPELRNRIYELLTVHDKPLRPQLRPVWRLHGKRRTREVGSYPREPSLSLVNRQLRDEVLSIFYGSNRFVFKESESHLLDEHNMTTTTVQQTWVATRPATRFIKHIDLRIPIEPDWNVSSTIDYTFSLNHDGHASIAYDTLSDESCMCLEDEAIAETMVTAVSNPDLMSLMFALERKRRGKLDVMGQVSTRKGKKTFLMLAKKCGECGKPVLKVASGGG